MREDNRRIVKNTVFLYLRMILVLAVSLYTTRILLKELGIEDFGIYNVVCGFVSMFTFMNTSMSNGIQRFYNYELGKNGKVSVQKVYVTAVIIQSIVVAVMLLLAETVGLWFLNHKMVIPSERMAAALWVFQFSVASFVLVILQVPYTAAVMAYENMNYYAFVSVLDAFLKLLLVLILPIVSGDKLIFYGTFLFIINIVNFVLYYVYCKCRYSEIKFKLKFNKELFRKMLSFSGWNIFGSCAYMVKGQGLNVLLNAFFGPAINSARGISYQIMNAVQSFTSSIVTSFRPQLVQSYAQGNTERTKTLMYSMSKFTFFLLYVIAVPVILEINYILTLWLGKEIPEYTIPFTILVIVSMLVSNFNTPLSLVVHAVGKMKLYQIVTGIIIMSVLPISWILLIIGKNPLLVFWADLFIVIVNQIVCLIVLRKIFPYSLNDYIRRVLIPTVLVGLLSLIIPISCHIVMRESFARLLCVAGTTVISSFASIYFFGLNINERNQVNQFIKRIINK